MLYCRWRIGTSDVGAAKYDVGTFGDSRTRRAHNGREAQRMDDLPVIDDMPAIDDMPVIDDRATLVIRLLPPAPQGHYRRCAEIAFGPVIIQVDAEAWRA